MLKHEQELTHSMAHYLLVVHNLKEKNGYARVTDIAKVLNLTKGSVSIAINSLKKKNLIEEQNDSKFLVLTEHGHDQVHIILSNRTILYYFFKDVLKVSEKIAYQDACFMEHLLSHETRDRFFYFLKNIFCSDADADGSGKNIGLSNPLCGFVSTEDFVSLRSSEFDFGKSFLDIKKEEKPIIKKNVRTT